MSSEFIDVSVDNAVMTVRMQRPEKKNALTVAMYNAIRQAVEDAGTRDDVHVVVIRGTEDCFTAGNDLGDFQQRSNDSAAGEGSGLSVIRALMALDKPVIAAVSGLAIGIGVTMLAHCDFVYVGESARLRAPFVDLGLCPEAASSLLLPLLVGPRRAADILLAADTLTGADAAACGLASAVYPDAELYQRVAERAQTLAAKPPVAMRESKRLMQRVREEQVSQTITVEGEKFAELLQAPEAQSIIAAFFKK